jgi:hypothetical protein
VRPKSLKKKKRPQFYHRVQNLTDVKFTKEELKVLYLGFHYSIYKPLTTFFASPIIEAENTIELLDAKYENEDIKKLKLKY